MLAAFGTRGRYWGASVVPFVERRTDFDSVWVQRNCKDGYNGIKWEHSRRKEIVEVLSSGPRWVHPLPFTLASLACDDAGPLVARR